jgi:hypothetical protein
VDIIKAIPSGLCELYGHIMTRIENGYMKDPEAQCPTRSCPAKPFGCQLGQRWPETCIWDNFLLMSSSRSFKNVIWYRIRESHSLV